MRMNDSRSGFALPTILVISLVMLTVLVATTSLASTVRSALNAQYYNQLAREASESGVALANSCLKANGYIATWGAGASGKPLRPNTGCTGGDACTNTAACYVLNSPDVKTTFAVDAPAQGGATQVITASGSAQLIRTSNGSVWRNYDQTSTVRSGAEVSASTVAFGYTAGSGGTVAGSYFLTIGADGNIKGTGQNSNGQLGTGATTSVSTPQPFLLPPGQRAAAIYTNFLSVGFNVFVVTVSGDVYGSGKNNVGQLGDGTTIDRSTPVKFDLPAGKKARYVGVLGRSTFVMTTDNNIYVAGDCTFGVSGAGGSTTSCSNITVPTRVALPTPNENDQNTIPTTNMSLDRYNTYVRMAGGRVYGWGTNNWGQLATGNNVDSSVPLKIGTYGDSGKPKATQIAFDGDTIYIVDSNGAMNSSGFNKYGQQGNDRIGISNDGALRCIDNKSFNGLDMQIFTCNGSLAQQWSWNEDYSIKNLNNGKCLDNAGADGTTIRLWTCNGSAAQKFGLDNLGYIYNWQSGRCLENGGGDGVLLRLWACNGSIAQRWTLTPSASLLPFSLPASAGKIVEVSTDQWSVIVRTDAGQVWGAGMNDQGQLGNAITTVAQPTPVRFIMPAGVTATSIYNTSVSGLGSISSNTYAIGSDGRVYGVGSNGFGQLGDGSKIGRSTPVVMQVINGTSVQANSVQSGYGTTIVMAGGRVYTVGNNANGQLGDGTTTNNSTPKANPYTNVLPLLTY